MTAKKPTALRVLSDNPSKRPLPKAEPKPTGKLTAPKSLTPKAKAIWTRVVHAMPAGVFTAADEGILAAYCEAKANHETATAHIAANGMFSTGSQGQEIVSPAVRVQSDNARLITQLGARLGFDPIARSGLSAAENNEDTEGFGID